ncbi:MAG TPA: hypothetical protein VMR06_03210 [Dokdonella sp.]|uniref:hypothetical protein n=1 Tax=Dokdonella sp. TaxID=2291710 RepID=UPI002B961789|nr:hypothetical protein [Dokdonella sp.]HUD40988.1 hypothetical protein [Dokdonella sp.]
MKIHDDHFYHGSALIQIAENPNFTAINALKLGKNVIRVAYRINDDISVYFKYASKPIGAHKEYVFTFNKAHLADLAKIAAITPATFVALICVEDREICTLPYAGLQALLKRREKSHGAPEDNLTVLVTAEAGKSLRAYVNASGKKNTMLGKALVVSRNAFPGDIFG